MFVEKYFSLILVAVVGINLLNGRHRAAALVESGRVTLLEVNNFAWAAFILLGGAFLPFWIDAQLARTDILYLIVFPPRRATQ
jgi:hypothetical protein